MILPIMDCLFRWFFRLRSVCTVGSIRQFLSFFLIFYAGQAYSRFMAQYLFRSTSIWRDQSSLVYPSPTSEPQAWSRYNVAQSAVGRLADISMLIKSNLSQAVAKQLFRHLHAAHALAYIGLSDTCELHPNPENLILPTRPRRSNNTVG